MKRFSRPFFERPTLVVARDLLGQVLVRAEAGGLTGGLILETEAYVGETDLACHARAGKTARTAVMYGRAGTAYVYFNYGMHWLFNVVTEAEGFPAAVLIRAIQPVYGTSRMAARRRGRPRQSWTDGPAKLCQALGIDGSWHGADLCAEDSGLFLGAGLEIPDSAVTTGPRVGLNKVAEPWKSIHWRFLTSKIEWESQLPLEA
jgi:DNA-3-methyladenine glycosylase